MVLPFFVEITANENNDNPNIKVSITIEYSETSQIILTMPFISWIIGFEKYQNKEMKTKEIAGD